MNEQDLIKMIKEDRWMMNVLNEAEKLNLPDWMIGAGFLRNKVWDKLHNFKKEIADTNDIDLVYFDIKNTEREDKKLSKKMDGRLGLKWEIVNQSYTHKWHNREIPYENTTEALSEWVETPTCVAVTLKEGEPKIIAPYGIDDLVNLIIRPSPSHKDNLKIFYNRIESKKWLKKWPKLRIVI
ncbi:MAG: nucleotidyltransferase family protein [bacterium]